MCIRDRTAAGGGGAPRSRGRSGGVARADPAGVSRSRGPEGLRVASPPSRMPYLRVGRASPSSSPA
ncbi:MAG: hypothetical protein QUU85_08450, partial [Candidatus Eisenbacteria bacterium]|nr:hypothetical protein [Candidatus Eisenbacteria bacterium]